MRRTPAASSAVSTSPVAANVEVKLIGKQEDDTIFVKKGHGDDEKDLFEFKTDEAESQQELAKVLPNSTVYYKIKLDSFEKEKESWDLNTKEKIEAAGKKKEEGNALFKAGKYARASKRYEKAAKFIEYDTLFSEDEKKQSKPLKIMCKLNDAACKLKLKDFKQAEKLCTKVLERESTNVKAMYKRTQAYMNLMDLDLVEFHIKKALELYPDNWDVKLGYKALKEKMKEYNKKDAKFYGNMFSKLKSNSSKGGTACER